MTIKNKHIYAILISIIVILVIFSTVTFSKSKKLEDKIENNYNRAFHELVNYVNNIDTLLEKSMVASSPSQISTIASELFRESTAAKACLGQLPVFDVKLENTGKFLSQTGDYTYCLSQNVINSKKINEEDYKNLLKLSDFASGLNSSLTSLEQDIYNGKIHFGTEKAENYFEKKLITKSDNIMPGLEKVENEFQQYPSLIYDGPFSDHIDNIKPKLIENEPDITKEEGLQRAMDFSDNKSMKFIFSGETENTPIKTYLYNAVDNDKQIYLSLTKKGGYPLYFINTRNVSEELLSFDEAIEKAKYFLKEKGFLSMKESYYDKSENIATINFAYTQSGIICYSDLIKVKVALDNGEILGMEAHGYIMNHCHRNFETPSVNKSEAKKNLNSNLTTESSNMALIPKESKKEVLCYEFKSNFNGKNFLLYVNCQTGIEEKILMLIESENGILTI